MRAIPVYTHAVSIDIIIRVSADVITLVYNRDRVTGISEGARVHRTSEPCSHYQKSVHGIVAILER